MKKVIWFIGLMLIAGSVSASAGKQYEIYVATNTGTTAYNFSKVSTEIYVVTMNTNTAYVSFTTTNTATTDFILGQYNQTDVIEHTEEINSSKMAVSQAIGPVNIRIMIKYW